MPPSTADPLAPAHSASPPLSTPFDRRRLPRPVGFQYRSRVVGRPVLLLHPSLGLVVRIHVPVAVAQLRRARVMGVPEMGGDRARGPVTHVLHRGADRGGHRVRLRRAWRGRSTACARLSCASGMPTNSTARAAASATTSPFGSAMPTSSDARITSRRAIRRGSSPAVDHAGEPVEAGVDVGPADALDERRQHVVVLVVAVPERAHRERGFAVGQRDRRAARLARERGGDVERRERVAGVALGAVGEVRERVVVDGEVLVAETTRVVGERTQQQRAQVVGRERLEPEQRGA